MDQVLQAGKIIRNPDDRYSDNNRCFQGIPSIACASNGRLWAAWYGGGQWEDRDNYIMVASAAESAFGPPSMIIDPPGQVRAYDAALWMDPKERLWLFWSQSYDYFDGRSGVWAIYTENPKVSDPEWSDPVRICDGIMMNKPLGLSNGEWLLPVSLCPLHHVKLPDQSYFRETDKPREAIIMSSKDDGKTFYMKSYLPTDRPRYSGDEHMLVEISPGHLQGFLRTETGIGICESFDWGVTWTKEKIFSAFKHIPSSRFHVRKLPSGNLLMIGNDPPENKREVNENDWVILPNGDRIITSWRFRSHICAGLSMDNGRTFPYKLILDSRSDVAYPDACILPDGTIAAVYDRERTGEKEILMALFRENDIIQGNALNESSRFLVNKATGIWGEEAMKEHNKHMKQLFF
ncbi:putative neuraminidase [Hungatella effluvii]|uniref:Putative neuraminidase n=1 Tax=Hungatella effluvii TaxID=1096246 RepID=A0A2V3YHI4_9FIRM|nr:sialidase family protein [Hungatella effluvii]PXX57090.1 putative neuraminidase [Hungatella effluvii]